MIAPHPNSFDGPFQHPIEYSPTDKKIMDHELSAAKRMLKPHLLLIQVIASRFQAVKYREPGIMVAIIRLLMRSFKAHKHMR
jgi:phosphatidylinositol 4-kinase